MIKQHGRREKGCFPFCVHGTARCFCVPSSYCKFHKKEYVLGSSIEEDKPHYLRAVFCFIRRKCLKCLCGSLLVFVPVGWLKFPFCWLSILFFPLLAVVISEDQLVKEIWYCLLGHAATFQFDHFIISTQIKYLAYAALPASWYTFCLNGSRQGVRTQNMLMCALGKVTFLMIPWNRPKF